MTTQKYSTDRRVMTKKDTASFFRFINEMNAMVEAGEKPESTAGEDQIRLQRQDERRERLGQLRARPKLRKKTGRAHSVFGYSDLS